MFERWPTASSERWPAFWANERCHIFHAAARSLKSKALAAVIVLIYLFMAKTEGTGTWHFAALLGTYGRHLSPFAAIGLNDFIN